MWTDTRTDLALSKVPEFFHIMECEPLQMSTKVSNTLEIWRASRVSRSEQIISLNRNSQVESMDSPTKQTRSNEVPSWCPRKFWNLKIKISILICSANLLENWYSRIPTKIRVSSTVNLFSSHFYRIQLGDTGNEIKECFLLEAPECGFAPRDLTKQCSWTT